ncbi:MAG: PD-(D/E)XK nuclease family protein [Chloroflexia bacterium]|nr:PD-(D/E)XK nuclease family protein [Chloroflexia bacterium]
MDFKPDLKNIKWIRGWRNMPEAYVRIKTPGVTTILNDMIPNPEIDEWIKAVGKEKADQITQASHDRGTAMHLFIEIFLKKLKETGDPSASLKEAQIQAPPQLEKENIPSWKIDEGRNLFFKFYYSDYISDYSKLIGTELDIYSPELFYRGKIDWTFQTNENGLAVRDFKSGSKPIEKGSRKELGYKYQLGAYAGGVEDMYRSNKNDVKVGYASIVNVSTKSEIVQNVECKGDELEEYKSKFRELAKEWHIKNGQGFLFQS